MAFPEVMTIAEIAERRSFKLDVKPHENKMGGNNSPKWWSFRIFGITVYCYNFKWRQQAIAHHDIHHIVTGYPCTFAGEVQVATWEFAAGRFPNIFANMFCLPLVCYGALVIPRKLWKAFLHGRRSRSLFSVPITTELVNSTLGDVRAEFRNENYLNAKKRDIPTFCALVALSFLLVFTPIMALILLLV